MKKLIILLSSLSLSLTACTSYPVANNASPDGLYHSNSLFGDLVMDAYGNFKEEFPNGRYIYGNVDVYSFNHPWWIYDSFAGHTGSLVHTGNGYASLGAATAGIYN